MRPKLYIFAISHYCEKARWTLDYLQIDYELKYTAPGLHMSLARKWGLPATSLPILDLGTEVIQGSAAIIDWADKITGTDRSLTPSEHRDEVLEIEKRLDDIAGVHTRRMFYSEALIEHPDTVRPIFTKDLNLYKALVIRAIWPKVRTMMIKRMDLGREQGEESKAILNAELDWLDSMLADGREFLVGDALSRADIAAAALFSPLAEPEEHPTYAILNMPPRAQATADQWRERPSIQWVRGVYRHYRSY
jgi:glutathione S-transferase